MSTGAVFVCLEEVDEALRVERVGLAVDHVAQGGTHARARVRQQPPRDVRVGFVHDGEVGVADLQNRGEEGSGTRAQ